MDQKNTAPDDRETGVTEPRVSIVLLSYNRPGYLPVALASALEQTMSDFEVIVADDCSPDPAVDELIRTYAARDKRVVYERPDRNIGVVRNLLGAVARSRSPYLTILCDDDALEPAYLERLLEPLERDRSLILSYCDTLVIDDAGNPDGRSTKAFGKRWKRTGVPSNITRPFIETAIVTKTIQLAMGALIRKHAIAWDDFPHQTGPAWDAWLGYLAARGGGGAAYVAERLFRYREHPSALTSLQDAAWVAGGLYVNLRLFADERLRSLRPVLRRRIALSYVEIGMLQLRRHETADARDAFRKSLQFGALPKAFAGIAISYLPRHSRAKVFEVYGAIRPRDRASV